MQDHFPSVTALSGLTFICQTCCFLIKYIVYVMTHLWEAVGEKSPLMIQALSDVIISYPSLTAKEKIF